MNRMLGTMIGLIGIGLLSHAAVASPCDDQGKVGTGNYATDPAHCKGTADALHISETEVVRRDRIMFARDRCMSSVDTRQGQEACKVNLVNYPYDWGY
jgi:hypothetical protein